MRRAAVVLALLAVLLTALRLAPKPPLAAHIPGSRSVLAVDGRLLRLTLAADEQYRLWTPLQNIAPPLREAVLLYEDRWFYWHPGVNPWALARSAVATLSGDRRYGGSTITMQLARRLYGIDSRSVSGKLYQAAAALWLELRYPKRDILEAYLNLAPYGGNVEGAGAASLVYFHKPASALSLPEALNLAVIPQNPRKRVDAQAEHGEGRELAAARRRLAGLWIAHHPADARLAADANLRLPLDRRRDLPFLAPHLVDALLRTPGPVEIRSSIDLRAQALVERILADYVKARADVGIANASALLVDLSTMQVKALVGSADYHDESIAGQVNGVFGRRSPGSTLKPFIYALALDQGLIHSASILRDAPGNFGGFAPENFDGRYAGPIPASEALIRSRNLPAVSLAARLNRPSLYDFLRLAGVQKLAPESHYGLALALGGTELSMEELAQLYAALANQGRWQELHYLAGGKASETAPALLSPEAAYIVLDMLRQTPRPDSYAPARPAIAWKTGTSWGFRDAWTAGIFGRHVLVVWVGNFDGASNPAFVGIDAAAPLFLRIVDALRAEKLDPGERAYTMPANLRRVEVCSASGDLPNAACPARSTAWFIAGKSPIRQSTVHRAVLVDNRSGKLACNPGPDAREEVFEYWSSDMRALFKKAGMPLREPPDGDCGAPAEGGPRIVAPLRGVSHVRRAQRPQPLLLRAEAEDGAGRLFWFAGDALIGQARPGESLSWNPAQAGRYLLRVVDANGRSDSREVDIEVAQ
ncbi:MAG: penicillin-binding protein 1C [Rhodocyclaceae bacterium]|nr:penicillin-binding protein 1C [Rhodocyclaceae bacterium]